MSDLVREPRTIDEIIVKGRQPVRAPPPFRFPSGPVRPGPGAREPAEPAVPPPSKGPEAFLPPVAPAPIPEIVVTAQRRATVRAVATRAVSWGSWFLAGGVALFELDRYRRRLQFEKDEESKRDAEKRRARRLASESVQTTIPEIIVRGKRPKAFAPSPYVLPPLPQIFPREVDPDPFIMEPIIPRELPIKPPTRTPDIETPTIPAQPPSRIPTRIPTRTLPRVRPGRRTTPKPEIRPDFAPEIRPDLRPAPAPEVAPRPAVAPQPAVNPFANPLVSPGISTSPLVSPANQLLTRLSRRMATSQRTRQALRTQAQAAADRKLKNCKPCKPCKKDKDKPRKECWRKLVKEARLPSQDTEYPWVPIDCDTGREIKGPRIWR